MHAGHGQWTALVYRPFLPLANCAAGVFDVLVDPSCLGIRGVPILCDFRTEPSVFLMSLFFEHRQEDEHVVGCLEFTAFAQSSQCMCPISAIFTPTITLAMQSSLAEMMPPGRYLASGEAPRFRKLFKFPFSLLPRCTACTDDACISNSLHGGSAFKIF